MAKFLILRPYLLKENGCWLKCRLSDLRRAKATISAEAPVTGVLHCRATLAKEYNLSFVVRQPNLGRSIFGKRAERENYVKKWRLFDCFKNANGIHFNKFPPLTPKMVHRAAFCVTFYR